MKEEESLQFDLGFNYFAAKKGEYLYHDTLTKKKH